MSLNQSDATAAATCEPIFKVALQKAIITETFSKDELIVSMTLNINI